MYTTCCCIFPISIYWFVLQVTVNISLIWIFLSEKHRDAAKSPGRNSKGYSPINKQPKKSALISRQRLAVPWKTSALDKEPSEQPLVAIDSERFVCWSMDM